MEPLQTSSVTNCLHDRICKPLLIEGSDDFSWPSVHLAVLDGWFDKGQHFSSLPHKCPRLSFFWTVKARRPPLLPSKSDMIVCHRVHLPRPLLFYLTVCLKWRDIKASYGTELPSLTLNVKLHPIYCVIVLNTGVIGIKLCHYAFRDTSGLHDITQLYWTFFNHRGGLDRQLCTYNREEMKSV